MWYLSLMSIWICWHFHQQPMMINYSSWDTVSMDTCEWPLDNIVIVGCVNSVYIYIYMHLKNATMVVIHLHVFYIYDSPLNVLTLHKIHIYIYISNPWWYSRIYSPISQHGILIVHSAIYVYIWQTMVNPTMGTRRSPTCIHFRLNPSMSMILYHG